MSDSEDDDWFTKDLDEFVAPKVVEERKDETCHSVTPTTNPYKDLFLGNSGGSYAPSQHVPVKSKFPDNIKFLPARLRSLLSKPDYLATLDLFIYMDRWKNTLQDFCNLKNRSGLNECLEILDKVVSTPLIDLKWQILSGSCKVESFFTWYVQSGLGDGEWKYAAVAKRVLKEILKISRESDLNVSFLDELKWDYDQSMGISRVIPKTILPSLTDFEGSLQELKAFPATGPIEHPDEYLSIQMDLLREESLHDLRIQIQEIRTKTGSPRFFPETKLTFNPESFEISIYDPPNEEYLYGSLLLFSTTHQFTDLILATVNDFNNRTRELKVDLIGVENINSDIMDIPLVMVPCPVFFEPLYRVHQQLKTMLGHPIPFQEIILNLNKSKHTEIVNKTSFSNVSKLYPRQSQAVTSGVSQRITLIQGPPGTGKSFVGQKIIENLLASGRKRILVISVTNHALDEVLKGVLATTQNIVRFGTQSKERELDEFNIKNIFCDQKNLSSLMRDGIQVSRTRLLDGLDIADVTSFISRKQKYLKLLQEIRNIETLIKIQSKTVIGMTTASAARLHSLLELYQPEVLIAEEAAEILECHSIAALTKSLKQMVLIGDHHQLRATLQVPHLSSRYHFDVSLFERLICNGMEAVQLDRQSRMRPELADLIRGIFYESYENNENVYQLPAKVRGVQRNVFFLDHQEQETVSMNKSKVNHFEVVFSLLLANYLLKQGYKVDQIAILGFYNVHLDMINATRNEPRFRHLQEVPVRTVDNFQGQEADIVILNAVRSNEESSIGHVAVKNRICTAMSRAKYGLFVLGNGTVLRERSEVWKELLEKFKEKEAMGRIFPLMCERHGNLIAVQGTRGFEETVSSLGGCREEVCGRKCEKCNVECGQECHPLWVGCDYVCNCY